MTDLPFLAPTLASALRLREFVAKEDAGIFIFTINVEEERLSAVNAAFGDLGLVLVSLDMNDVPGIDAFRLAKTQTPLGTFGRFFMEDHLPSSCRHIVYLDGDVWPVRDPSALVMTPVPDGRIAAAHDPVTYRRRVGGSTALSIDSYFKSLKVSPERGYFNAGVLAATRTAWREIARDAYAYYREHIEVCKHFDQSALNAVASERRVDLSCRWNFQTQYKFWGADAVVEPRLYHFTRNPKPWSCRLAPWPEMFAEYERVFARLKGLDLPIVLLGPEEEARANEERRRYMRFSRPPVSWAVRGLMGLSRTEAASWL